MSLLTTAEAGLTRPMGPLPLWGWVAIGGVGFAAYRVIKAHGAATNGATAGSTTTDTTGTGSSGPGSSPYGPVTLNPGQTVYDPSTGGNTTSPTISVKDLLGGSASDFIKSLGANYSSFSFGEGSTSLSTTNSAQNVLDAANYQAKLIQDTQQAAIAAQESAVNEAYYYASQYGIETSNGTISPNPWFGLTGQGIYAPNTGSAYGTGGSGAGGTGVLIPLPTNQPRTPANYVPIGSGYWGNLLGRGGGGSGGGTPGGHPGGR